MRDRQSHANSRDYSADLTNYMNQAGRFELLNAEQEVDLAQQIEAGIYASHLLEVDEDKQELTPEYKQALGEVALEGFLARQELINANTLLAINKAKKYRRAMVHNDFSDLINNANLGLIEAASTFDYKKGLKFSTYAGLLIEQSLYRESNSSDSTIRIPVKYLKQCHDIDKVRRDYELIHGHQPSDEYVAEQLPSLTVEAIALADKHINRASIVSLDMPVAGEEEDLTIKDIISNKPSDEDDQLFETEFEQQAVFKKLNQLIDSNLSSRDAQVVRMHYGFLDDEPMNFSQIGEELDYSRERIRQIHKQSIQKLIELPEMAALKTYFEA